MFVLGPGELAGLRVERLFDSFSREFLEPTLPRSEKAGERCDVRRVGGKREDGSIFPVDISVERVPSEQGPLTIVCARYPDPPDSDHDTLYARAARVGKFGFWSLDLVSNTVFLSREALQIMGLAEGTYSAKPDAMMESVHPEERAEIFRLVDGHVARRERMDFTTRIVRPDGSTRVTRIVAEFRFREEGEAVELLGILFDITDRARLDVTLRESQATLDAIVNSTTAVIYIKDIDKKYLLVNCRYEDLFDLESDEIIGKTDYEIFSRKVADSLVVNDELVVRAGHPMEFEEHVPSDGEERIYISIKFPLRRSTGEIYAVCGISTDITERTRIESELERTRQSLEQLVDERTAELRDANRELQREVADRERTAAQLQRLFDTAREGIWIIDAEGMTTFANPRMAEILGYTPDEMIGCSFYEFMPEAGRLEAGRNLARRRDGISEEHDFEFMRKDGTTLWTLLATGPVHAENGEIVGALAMVTDISERKHAEQQQLLLLQELDHRVKNTLATVMALSEITMSHAGSVEEFASAFGGRIQAMARTHETLASGKWNDVSFLTMANRVLAPFGAEDAGKIQMSGDPIMILPHVITPLALTLNEFGTNALKHGALSGVGGLVRIEWWSESGVRFVLTWEEQGGPPVSPPSQEGIGLQLIRGLIEYELGGTVALQFAPSGLSCRVEIPIAPPA